jgi:hypothetical protein
MRPERFVLLTMWAFLLLVFTLIASVLCNGDVSEALCGHGYILPQLKKPLPRVHQTYRINSNIHHKRSVDQNYTTTTGLVSDSDFQPARILFDFRYLDNNSDPQACYSVGAAVTVGSTSYQCTANDVITPVKANNTVLIINAMKSIITKRIQLRTLRVIDALFLNATVSSCGFDRGVPVPTQYFQNGIPDTDLVYI